jgi:hypothetical protein
MRQFVRNCTVKPLAPDDFERALCWNIIVRPDVRGALGRRVIDSDDVLSTLRVPLLVAHGRKDIIIVVCRINFPYLDTKISLHFEVFAVKQAHSDTSPFLASFPLFTNSRFLGERAFCESACVISYTNEKIWGRNGSLS